MGSEMNSDGDGMARDPDEVLSELLFGFLGTQLLYVVSELGIADLIDSEPETIDVLASRAGASPDVLYRILRALAALGVFTQIEDRAFAQTSTSKLLRRDSGSGWHEFTIVYGSVYRAFAEALPAVKTGDNMFERASGSGWWEWLAARPELGSAFNRAMQAGAQARIAALRNFPWQEVDTVIATAARSRREVSSNGCREVVTCTYSPRCFTTGTTTTR